MIVAAANQPAPCASTPQTRAELITLLDAQNIRAYPRRCDVRNFPAALKRERRPALLAMSALSQLAAQDLPLDEKVLAMAIRAALHQLQAKEKHTELTRNTQTSQDVAVVTDRVALAQARGKLLDLLPQTEEADVAIILHTLAGRALPSIEATLAVAGAVVSDPELRRATRDVACWIARSETDPLA